MNQWVGSRAARNPPDPARMGGAIWLYKRPFRNRILRFLLLQRRRLRLHWPRSLLAVDTPRSWTQRPRSARLIRLLPVPFAAAIRRISRTHLKEQIGVLMPRRYCGSCRSPLHADDGHSKCVFCLGKSHADAALAGSDCSHCENISLASLRSRIAFFSEHDPTPRALPFSSSQGPVRKKQRGRGSQRRRASLSPHREVSPVLFSQPDQRPSASSSDLVSFGGSDDELADDSMSLASSDEELSGSVTDPPPHVCPRPAPPKPGWMPNFSVSSQNRLKSWVWSGLHQRSPLTAVWMSGSCRGAVRPLSNDPRCSSLKFTTSSRDLGAPLTLPASVLLLHPPSPQLTALKKRGMRGCLN